MNWEAIGGIELAQWAFIYVLALLARRQWKRDGVTEYLQQRAENRSQRRAENRGRLELHELNPFPGDDDEAFEKLATTGELRAIAYEGDTGRLKDEIAAFFRVQDLREWTRKRAGAA